MKLCSFCISITILGMIGVLFDFYLLNLFILFVMPLCAISHLVPIFVGERKWFMRLLALVYRGAVLVECVDFQQSKYWTFVKDRGDGILVGPLFWWTQTGQVVLLPNGVVHPRSSSCYVYFWQPANYEQRVIMSLQYPEFQSIDLYKNITSKEMSHLQDQAFVAYNHISV